MRRLTTRDTMHFLGAVLRTAAIYFIHSASLHCSQPAVQMTETISVAYTFYFSRATSLTLQKSNDHNSATGYPIRFI